jgi:hypothetical protein
MSEQVRVLLDEGVPEKLRTAFSDTFVVETVRFRGWTGLKNGELLQAAEGTYDALGRDCLATGSTVQIGLK